jgi:thiamine biosynthesis lipoprotein
MATMSAYVHVEHVMGTVVSLDVRDSAARAETAVRAAMASLHDVDARFSTYRADSEICRLDRGELRLADASPDVRVVLQRCAQLRGQTGGFFDERVAGRLDPSAFVKGWAAQGAAHILAAYGLTDFCVNAGGDVVTRGGALPEAHWRVGIQHPLDRDAVSARVSATDLAIATTGTYERGAHVIHPYTGAAPDGVLSVTVTGPDLGTADAFSTAAFAMGIDGPAWTLGLKGYEAMTILADGRMLSTPAFPAERSPASLQS